LKGHQTGTKKARPSFSYNGTITHLAKYCPAWFNTTAQQGAPKIHLSLFPLRLLPEQSTHIYFRLFQLLSVSVTILPDAIMPG
jgi:hypothetical protein